MFNTKIPLYGICILVSIITGTILIYKESSKIFKEKEYQYIMIFYSMIGVFFGAKYYTLITRPDLIKNRVNFFEIGLSSYGAVIGLLSIMYIYSRQIKIKYLKLLSVFIKPIPLMYGIGKLGCFFAGCCHGIEYNGPFSIVYNYSPVASAGINYFPVQLLETIVFIIIYIYITKQSKRDDNVIISQTFILCGLSKFLLDFLRISHNNIILSTNQVVSILFVITGIYLLIKQKKVHN